MYFFFFFYKAVGRLEAKPILSTEEPKLNNAAMLSLARLAIVMLNMPKILTSPLLSFSIFRIRAWRIRLTEASSRSSRDKSDCWL